MNYVEQKCPYCGRHPIIRVHKKDGVYCNTCNEPLLKQVDSWSGKRYAKCLNPACGYYGPETVSPNQKTRCPKCNTLVLRHEQ